MVDASVGTCRVTVIEDGDYCCVSVAVEVVSLWTELVVIVDCDVSWVWVPDWTVTLVVLSGEPECVEWTVVEVSVAVECAYGFGDSSMSCWVTMAGRAPI